jgi:predicted nucleic acid-binding protein
MSERVLLVDASVVITLARVDCLPLPRRLDGRVAVPEAVVAEVASEPAESALDDALEEWASERAVLDELEAVGKARAYLGAGEDATGGDCALLAAALHAQNAAPEMPVVVTDDKPLRETCKALSVPVSGSLGVLIRAVEQDTLDADEAKARLLAMDEVGARLSASLLRRAERLIDEAARD